jgi:hypothetical protein
MLGFSIVVEARRGEINTTRKYLAFVVAECDLVNLCFSKNSEILSIDAWFVISSPSIALSTPTRVSCYQIAGDIVRDWSGTKPGHC